MKSQCQVAVIIGSIIVSRLKNNNLRIHVYRRPLGNDVEVKSTLKNNHLRRHVYRRPFGNDVDVKPTLKNNHLRVHVYRRPFGNDVEVKHVAFLKVHKTGSTSVQNIFIRFGESRKLTFVLASVEHNECNNYTNCISFNRTLHDGNIVPPPNNKQYEILCSHVIYNKSAFQKYLPRDTRYIGIVRHPVRRVESAIAFFRELNKTSLTSFAKSIPSFDHNMTNNRMAFEFGFNRTWFPNASHTEMSWIEKAKVIEYVDQIMQDFDLILVNERLNESLVLMRRLLGWTIQDILYERKGVREHDRFNTEDEGRVTKYLYLDFILYTRSVAALDKQIAQAGPGFHDEVNNFRKINNAVQEFCKCKTCKRNRKEISASQWNAAFNVTKRFCKAKLGMYEIKYLERIRRKQYYTKLNSSAVIYTDKRPKKEPENIHAKSFEKIPVIEPVESQIKRPIKGPLKGHVKRTEKQSENTFAKGQIKLPENAHLKGTIKSPEKQHVKGPVKPK